MAFELNAEKGQIWGRHMFNPLSIIWRRHIGLNSGVHGSRRAHGDLRCSVLNKEWGDANASCSPLADTMKGISGVGTSSRMVSWMPDV